MDYLIYSSPDELMHYGIKGMHWGIRRYQPYPDGHTGGKFIGKRQAKKMIRTMNYNSKIGAMRMSYAKDSMIKAEKHNAKGKIKKRDKQTRDAQKHMEEVDKLHAINRSNYSALKESGYDIRSTLKSTIVPPTISKTIPLGPILSMAFAKRAEYVHYKAIKPKIQKAKNNVKNVKLNNQSQGLYIATTHDQAKKIGLGEKTRVTGKEEQEFWKALAAEYIKNQKS